MLKNDQEFDNFLKDTNQKIDREMANKFMEFLNNTGDFNLVCTPVFVRNNPNEKITYSCEECGMNNILGCERNEETCRERHAKLTKFFEEVLKNNDYNIKRFKFTHSQMMQVVAQEIMEQKDMFSNTSFNPTDLDDCIVKLEKLIETDHISVEMLKNIYMAVSMGHATVINYLPNKQWLFLSGKGSREDILDLAIKASKQLAKKSPYGKNYFKKKK